jgi:hypothetical protein
MTVVSTKQVDECGWLVHYYAMWIEWENVYCSQTIHLAWCEWGLVQFDIFRSLALTYSNMHC